MGPPVEFNDLLAESELHQKQRPFMSAMHLFVPLGLFLGGLVVLYLIGELGRIGSAIAAAFFVAGKLLILKGAISNNVFEMSAYQLAVMVFIMDCWVAYLFTFNLHRLYRIPRVGPWLKRLQNYCQFWLSRQPWMRRWALTGVTLFVMFPLTGTGAPGGAILGRLVGLKAVTTLLAVALGSAIGCGIMAHFADQLEPMFAPIQDEWWFMAVGIGIIAVLLLMLFWLGRRISRAADAYADTLVDRDA